MGLRHIGEEIAFAKVKLVGSGGYHFLKTISIGVACKVAKNIYIYCVVHGDSKNSHKVVGDAKCEYCIFNHTEHWHPLQCE